MDRNREKNTDNIIYERKKDKEDISEMEWKLLNIHIDISRDKKEKAYSKMMDKLDEENNKMKNKENIFLKRVASIALVAVIGIGAVQTGFAQDMYDRFERIIGLKYVTVEEKAINPEGQYYMDSSDNSAGLKEKEEDNNYVYIDDLEKAREYMNFDLRIPSPLPEGYEFKNVCFYVEKPEDIHGDYATLFFTNGEKEFFIKEVFAKEENSFKTRGSEIEEIDIDGTRAVIDRKGNIDTEIDDVIVSVLTLGNISREESIEIIKNIK